MYISSPEISTETEVLTGCCSDRDVVGEVNLQAADNKASETIIIRIARPLG